jgi:hypothetical protein
MPCNLGTFVTGPKLSLTARQYVPRRKMELW